MASTTAAIGSASPATPNMGAIAFAGTLGTIIEWYDFLIYGTAAALVFNKLFFPTVTPLAGTLAALATYAVGFVARPVGGALFGYFGDRIGRKSMLMLTMFVMGLGTFLIGLLPTYGQIGIWAPVLLVVLRFIQGIGLGGEWGGASLMVLEHAPSDRRGFYGSLVQVGFPLGLVTSSGVFAIVTLLPEDQFLAWGWRIPFLISIVLVALGAFIRARIPETPVFEAIKAKQDLSSNPFYEAVFRSPRAFLVALGLKLSEVSWVYMLTVFVVVYATTKLALPRTLLLDAIFWAAVIEVATIPLNGTTSLSFALANPNPRTSLTGVSFIDNLPAGLVVATPNAAHSNCASGTIVARPGSSTISLFGVTLLAGRSCTVSVNVTGTTTGMKVNTTVAVTSVESGPGSTASASIAVGTLPVTGSRSSTYVTIALTMIGLGIALLTISHRLVRRSRDTA